MDNQFKEYLGGLIKYMVDKLNLSDVSLPKLILKNDKENAKKLLGKTGYYDPETKTIVVYVTSRHPKDQLRSICHEFIHFFQDINGKLDTTGYVGQGYAQKNPNLRKNEKQAFLLGNIIMRDFEDQFKEKLVKESELTRGDNDTLTYSDEDDAEEEAQRKAERYFSIGQDEEDSENNYCWAWLDNKL